MIKSSIRTKHGDISELTLVFGKNDPFDISHRGTGTTLEVPMTGAELVRIYNLIRTQLTELKVAANA